MMVAFKLFCTAVLTAAWLLPMSGVGADSLKDFSLTQLEQRLKTIDADLEQLARTSLRSGVGSVGYRSLAHETNTAEWIQVDLGEETPIDQVVLVPAIWRDTKSGFRADGFPLEFKMVAGTGSDTNGVVIASFTTADDLLPRIAPLVVPCAVTASWVRVEAAELSHRVWDGKYDFQLAEMLVFSGPENVALRKPVTTSSKGRGEGSARKEQFLTDGFLPYLMDVFRGERSIAFVSGSAVDVDPVLSIDLGAVYPLNRVHLHAVDLSDTVPQSTPADFGTPRRMIIEGATRSDFSDAVQLVEYEKNSVFDVGPILMLRFPETACRYVRIIAVDPYVKTTLKTSGFKVGFAEIELFSKGRNVALGRPFVGNFESDLRDRSLVALTDGCNFYGSILPVRDWLSQLAFRHDLETERPVVDKELTRRYVHQKTNINRLIWIAVLLAAGIGFTILIDRLLRQRAVHKTRERIAADLHDELGANLHAIGLLGAIAEDSVDSRDDLIETVRRIRELTRRTGAATRLCTNVLESSGICEDLVEEMKRASYRLLADLEHEIVVEGEELLHRLKSRRRIDLFLFYKECLTNIIRHSGATRVRTQLTADHKGITLVISDNGQGTEQTPGSLKRRARFLNAKLTVEASREKGTEITLRLRQRFILNSNP
jgi:signal transduction histidine kinase